MPADCKRFIVDGGFVDVHLHRLQMDDTWLWALNEGERKRAAAFNHAEDRLRFIAAHGFARDVLAGYEGCEPEDVSFAFSEVYGRPALPEGGLDFNLSYRGNWALLGVGTVRLGVDIERYIVMDDIEGFAENFFSEKERLMLNDTIPNSKTAFFFRQWTLKEAYIKALGVGLSYPLQMFSVVPNGQLAVTDSGSPSHRDFLLELPVDGMNMVSEEWGFKLINAPQDYSAALCYGRAL